MVSIKRQGPQYLKKLNKRRDKSIQMLADFLSLADLCISLGGEVSFEWPRNCTGWMLAKLQNFIKKHSLYLVDVDGCSCGMKNSKGEPLLKQWKFACSSPRLAASLRALRCRHPAEFTHGTIEGTETKATERYPASLCRTVLAAQFGFYQHCPAMACVPAPEKKQQHRELEEVYPNFCISPFLSFSDDSPVNFGVGGGTVPIPAGMGAVLNPADDTQLSSDPSGDFECGICMASSPDPLQCGVHKLLDRKEMRSCQEALDAVRAEADGLLSEGTWLTGTVTEFSDLVAKARADGKTIYIGDIMPICSIKHWETPALRKYKGRIVFRGDCVKDQDGAAAVFQELSASPTTIHSANSNIAYGCIPGNKSTQADAIRAYVQSFLKSKHETWARIPPELWPKEWRGKYSRPTCKLVKALYGHPESGGHWERHLTDAIKAIGGKPVPNHPSSFWFEESKLLLTVYVDDLLLSGPAGAHAAFWKKLRSGPIPINIEDLEPLDRFLGRTHIPWKVGVEGVPSRPATSGAGRSGGA